MTPPERPEDESRHTGHAGHREPARRTGHDSKPASPVEPARGPADDGPTWSQRPRAPAGAAASLWARHGQFVKFVAAAGASVPVNLAARVLFSRAVPYEVAVLLSHVVGMLTAYSLTRLFVFAASGRSVPSELGRFALVNLVSAALTWVVSVGLLRLVFPRVGFETQPELVAHVVGLGVASVSSFIGHRQFSFRRRG